MSKDHPYVFNMGGGASIPYQNYQEAVKMLMERNMPDVLHNKQTEVVFLPQSYLPKVPRVVDLQAYETKTKSLSVKLLGFLGMKKGREDAANALDNIAERDIAEKLQNFFVKFAS